jgi:hypothetical protein
VNVLIAAAAAELEVREVVAATVGGRDAVVKTAVGRPRDPPPEPNLLRREA